MLLKTLSSIGTLSHSCFSDSLFWVRAEAVLVSLIYSSLLCNSANDIILHLIHYLASYWVHIYSTAVMCYAVLVFLSLEFLYVQCLGLHDFAANTCTESEKSREKWRTVCHIKHTCQVSDILQQCLKVIFQGN